MVDAWAAQAADAASKPITVAFALVGLYLHVERGVSGRRVQRVHMELGRTKQAWPRFALPASRGAITPAEVMAAPEGAARDAAVDAWCRSVWEAYAASRGEVVALLERHGISG